jgi:hypothetical protein
MTEFHHIKVSEFVIGWPKIILDAGLVAGMKRQFRRLNTDLTWNLSFSVCRDILKPYSVSVQWMLERNCGLELNNLQVK